MPRQAPIAIVAAAFGAMAWWTWGTTPDVLVDFGRELYVPWRLSEGDVLYRDIAWLHGPLSPYLNAGWFLLFGVSLRSLTLVNLVLLAALIWGLFRIVSALADRLSATVAALTCVILFGFSISNYNFVAPYSHELTHGVALSVGAMAAFASYLRTGRLISMSAAGLATGLAFLTKAEVFLAIAAALLAGLAAAFRTRAMPDGARRHALMSLAGAAIAPLIVTFLAFWSAMPAAEARQAVFGAWRYVLMDSLWSSPYYLRIAGLIDPFESMRAILTTAAGSTVVFGLAALAAIAVGKRSMDRVLAAALAFAAGVVLFGLGTRTEAWDQVARPLPILMLAAIFTIMVQMAKRLAGPREERVRAVVQVTFVLFALVLLARMVLNVTFYRYGFVLAMPATIVLVMALVSWVPARLAASGGDAWSFRAFALAGWLVLMVAHFNGASAYLREKQLVVSTGQDAFVTDLRGQYVNDFLTAVQHRLRPDDTLVVLPEGVMLNYLSRRVNPTPYVTFMPPELAAFGEAQMLEALQRRPPEFVALAHKDTSEYGPRFFGQDYGRSIFEWIASRYRAVHTFGAAPLHDGEFGIRLLERIDRP